MRTAEIAPTPRVQRILDAAATIAKAHGHDYLGTEHLILAIVQDRGGIASHVLRELEVDNKIAAQVEAIMATEAYHTESPHPLDAPGD